MASALALGACHRIKGGEGDVPKAGRGTGLVRAKGAVMKRLRILAFLLLITSAAVQATPLCLDLELRKSSTRDGQTVPEPAQTVHVVLADDYLEFTDSDGRVVHDFESNKSHLVSGDDYAVRSLYADIGFRVAELRNRLALIEALKDTDAAAVVGEVVQVEHLLGLDDEVSEAPIVKAEGKVLSYKFADRLLAEFSAKGRKLSPEQSKAFVRFLRYYCGGHPDILADVRARAVLPDDFRIDVVSVAEVDSYQMHVTSAKECSPVRPDFSSLRPTVLPPEPLGSLAALALQLTPQAVDNAQKAALARADQALAKGQTLQAALFYFEVLLMQGAEPPAAFTAARPTFEADPDSRLLLGALLAGQEDPKKAVAALTSLEAKAGPAAHVLKIFKAGFLLPQGEAVAARDLDVEALLVNPALAAAWKDLGDVYHSNFETDMAWLCWDIGRKLAPNHQMLQDVTKLEQVLRSNYPGFF